MEPTETILAKHRIKLRWIRVKAAIDCRAGIQRQGDYAADSWLFYAYLDAWRETMLSTWRTLP